MKKILLAVIVHLLSYAGIAQNCSCPEKLLSVENLIKNNYAGFNDKVTIKGQRQYNTFKASILKQALHALDFHCNYLIKKYLSYFKDEHISIEFNESKIKKDSIRSFFKAESKILIDEEKITQYLDFNKDKADKIEGIWTSIWDNVKLVILKDSSQNNLYLGVVLRGDNYYWTKGQVKFLFRKTIEGNYKVIKYLNGYHLPVSATMEVEYNIINIRPYGVLKRVYPQTVFDHQLFKYNSRLSFRILNDSTCYLAIPSFNSYAKRNIDSVVSSNKKTILNSKNFIIDIRDNSGGAVRSYDALLPIFYTNNIVVEGASFMASEKNIKNYSKRLSDSSLSTEYRKQTENKIMKLKSNIGKLVPIFETYDIKYDSVYKYPRNIAILFNQNTASTAELFLKVARQSKKVVFFGENSSGTVDYGDINSTQVDCMDNTLLYFPVSRVNNLEKVSIDNVGMTPDVRIPLRITNWIDFVHEYFRNK
jgi:Peptidase family S41